ncbi:hypothetical protein ABJI51_02490 [Amycolatopsis sp. NEAU-NG30]|uniref:Secreted protein n=1 Tax=Amycolatopsis melonis TaxID=3156488 RepID=A0ABV0L6J8_9PSEU
MRAKLFRAAVPAVVAVGACLLFPQIASAGGKSADCSTPSCEFGVEITGTTTFHVDFDVHGSGEARWTVTGPRGYVCTDRFRAEDPPRSVTCVNYPTGFYKAKVEGPEGPSNIGLRW